MQRAIDRITVAFRFAGAIITSNLMKLAMAILSVLAALFGIGCSEKRINVQFVNASTREVFAESHMLPEQLPETFAVETQMTIQGKQWSVVHAEPENKSEFVRTGKLRVTLSEHQTLSADDIANILYSLPTISDALPSVTGDKPPGADVYSIHEDDWRQVEFVSKRFAEEVKKECSDVLAIHKNHKKGYGFVNLHLRQRIPNPLAAEKISYNEAASLLSFDTKAKPVGFFKNAGTIPNSFAWPINGGFAVWGTTNDAGHLTHLCLTGKPEAEVAERISKSIADFTAGNNLLFVDWCSATQITADSGAFKDYFGERPQSHSP